MSTELGWGASSWGESAWGSGDEDFALVLIEPRRDNVLRVAFSQKVFLDGLKGPFDASSANRWDLQPILASVGLDGEPARLTTVIFASLAPEDDVDEGAFGYLVDLFLDRPMSPWPCAYTLTVTGVYSEDLTESVDGESATVSAMYRLLQRPEVSEATPSRDIASPYTASMAAAAGGSPILGSYIADPTGDYAFDQGIVSLKKRLYQRLITIPGAFAHLPKDYGVGVTSFSKKLATAAVQTQLVTLCEEQFGREPEVAKVRCALVQSAPSLDPGAWILRAFVRTRAGLTQKYDLPIG